MKNYVWMYTNELQVSYFFEENHKPYHQILNLSDLFKEELRVNTSKPSLIISKNGKGKGWQQKQANNLIQRM